MYYVAKIFQAAGLTIILIGFVAHFPNLMSHSTLLIGLMIFAFGWTIQQFLLRVK